MWLLIVPRIINTAVDEIKLYNRVVSHIYENNKDSVTKNNQPVNGEHQQTNLKEHLKFYKIFW